jgi:hypothetical protein
MKLSGTVDLNKKTAALLAGTVDGYLFNWSKDATTAIQEFITAAWATRQHQPDLSSDRDNDDDANNV